MSWVLPLTYCSVPPPNTMPPVLSAPLLMTPENVDERLPVPPSDNVVPLALLSTTLPLPERLPIVGVESLKLIVPKPKPPSEAFLLTVTAAVGAMLPVVFKVALSAAVAVAFVGLTVTLPAPNPPATADVNVPPFRVVPPLYE